MFGEMPLDQALRQYAPQANQPQVMAGTALPEQQQQTSMQEALINALRQQQAPQQAPQQAGNVVAASGGLSSGLDTKAIGGAINSGIDMFKGTGNYAPADLAGTSFI